MYVCMYVCGVVYDLLQIAKDSENKMNIKEAVKVSWSDGWMPVACVVLDEPLTSRLVALKSGYNTIRASDKESIAVRIFGVSLCVLLYSLYLALFLFCSLTWI